MQADEISSPLDINLYHFRSGRFPSVTEIRAIESFCNKAEKQIDRYNSKLNATMTTLERKPLDLQESVQLCRAFISPLRKVPAEIWVEIFSELANGSLVMIDLDDGKDRIWSSTLPLSQTCLFWRAVALSTPELWTSLKLDLSSNRHGLRDLVQLCLQRSKLSPLTLDIKTSREPSAQGCSIFSDLMNARSRWLHVKVDTPWDLLKYSTPPHVDAWDQPQFDILKELEVLNKFEFGAAGDPPFRALPLIMLEGSLSLRSLKIQGGFCGVLAHSFVNLIEVHLNLASMQDLVECFTLCSRLRKASLSSFDFYDVYEGSISPLPTKITHHSLSWLEFEFVELDEATAILSSLVLPSLVTLDVKFDLDSFFERTDDDGSEYFEITCEHVAMESLKVMVTQSSCPLEELGLGAGFITCGEGASDRALMELLASTPRLTHLRISAQRYSTFSNEFFHSLTFSAPSATAQKVLLPLLEVLHVRVTDFPQFNDDYGPLPDPGVIFTMVASRRAKGCTTQLKIFHFDALINPTMIRSAGEWLQSFTTFAEPRLRGLEADGLELFLRVVLKDCYA